MSYKIKYTEKIKKDIKKIRNKNVDVQEFKDVIEILESDGKLPTEYKPHKLKGNYNNYWECHIQPDWLLIWKQNDSQNIILIMRTGTHSDLF